MINKIIFISILVLQSLYADFEYRINNSNFTISQDSIIPNEDETYIYNYNRFRFLGDYKNENIFSTLIIDGVNYIGNKYTESNSFSYLKKQKSDTSFKTQTAFHDYENGSSYAKIYRLYAGYEDNQNRIVLGLQNISMGVGRIWTPINLFNPKNSYALEPDEVLGVAAASYARNLNDTSIISFVFSQKADHSFKYASSYKSFFQFIDLGIHVINSDETKMFGYEVESNLSDTGIEIRSEGAYIKNDFLDKTEFFQAIVGADYGFEDGLNLVAEALYSSKTFSQKEISHNFNSEILSNLVSSNLYAGLTLTYDFNIFLNGSLVYIGSVDTKDSHFVSSSITYTLNDYNSFMIGALINDSESDILKELYYFKYTLSF